MEPALTTCIWTGRPFRAVERGGHHKTFIDSHARNEAMSAARAYALWLIDEGLLSWQQVRHWHDARNGAKPACTLAKTPSDPPAQVLFDFS